MSGKRRVLAAVCVVVVIATAMAPLASSAFCCELVQLPMLLNAVVIAPLPDPPAPRISLVIDAAPRALRAPPAA